VLIQLLAIYKWNLVTGVVQAGFLSILGIHLSARDKTIQSLCLSQAATFGVLLGLGISDFLLGTHEHDFDLSSIAIGLLSVLIIFLVSEKLSFSKKISRSSFFVSLFLVLLALSYWLVSFFPSLESHMSQTFFGDLVTLSGLNLYLSLIVSTLGLIILLVNYLSFSRDSFNFTILDLFFVKGQNSWWLFQIIVLMGLTISIFASGFLFTVTSLFLPTVLFSFWPKSGLLKHHLLCLSLSTVSTGLGFFLSLVWSRFPTVPTIVIVQVSLGTLVILLAKLVSLIKSNTIN
jgi:ABC-type Mn2+/Zn2+ transport system permease subunit